MKKVGEIIKEKRIEKRLTLRNFCEMTGLDPSNWSKIERGRMEFPKSSSILSEIAGVLELNEEELQEIKDLATIQSIPSEFRPEEEILNSLPVFFRTARELKPSEEQLNELIELLKRN